MRYYKNLTVRISKNGLCWTFNYYVKRIRALIFSFCYFHRADIKIDPSASMGGLKYIKLGNNFMAGRGLWLQAYDEYTINGYRYLFHPQIIIGDNVIVNEYVHIGCVNRIKIGNNVLMGSKIYITDHNHGVYRGDYPDSPDVPPVQRPLTEGEAVIIEDNVWLGEFVTVLPGVTIGYGSIIGTHSTVTHDIPPKCIAVGSPARVIKRWNEDTHTWDQVAKK